MNLEDVISNYPVLTVDSVVIAYRRSPSDKPEMVWVNDAFCELFSVGQIDLIGHDLWSLYHDDYVADFVQTVEETAEAGRNSFATDTLCIRQDGSSFWASVSFFALHDDNGQGSHSVIMIRDIDLLKSREQAAELALIENELLLSQVEAAQMRLISAINTIPDPFAIFDAGNRLVIWNPAFEQSLCGDTDSLSKKMKPGDILRVGTDNGVFPNAVGQEEIWLKRQNSFWSAKSRKEFLLAVQDSEYRVILSPAPNGDTVALHVDISEYLDQKRELEKYAERLEKANFDISHQALHDELTGLGNRRYLTLKLNEMTARRDRQGGEIAALHIDLDRFKQINDNMGHAAGDHVLTSVASTLRAGIRSGDVIARTGGDEFVVLVRCSENSDDPQTLAARLIEDLSVPVSFEGRPCRFGASVGIARTPLIEAEELLTSSDIALYKAKTSGRSRYAVFDEVDLEKQRANKSLTEEIARGLENNEFVPFYQPQFDSHTGEIAGFETMARWHHPERGILAPSIFGDTATEMQVDGQIDMAIFRKALAECQKEFSADRIVPNLSFNVSLQHILEPEFTAEVRKLKYPGQLSLELVESLFLADQSDELLACLDSLRELGISFEVDDFGSGSASIVALRRIGPDQLKIDGRLVKPITKSDQARRLVQSIIDIGRALEIGVTAEGVDTAEHVDILSSFGCDRLQGGYYSPPLSFDDFKTFVREEANRGLRAG